MNRIGVLTVAIIVLAGIAVPAWAQMPAPPPQPDVALRSDPELDQLLGPIALYPDPLIAQILPAATQPTQIVLAERYISAGGDPNQLDTEQWDPSVQAIARYPSVLKMLSDNLAWTTDLGQAFVNQQQDVMDTVQRLRSQAQELGNLPNTPQDTVESDDGDIDIVPADPNEIYVPQYDPNVVYYQPSYGQTFITFGIGFPVGIWLDHDFDWHNHHVIVWGHDNPRPRDWWHRPPDERFRPEVVNHVDVWQPRGRAVVNPVYRGDRGYQRPVVTREVRPAPRPAEQPAQRSVTVIGRGEQPAGRNVTVIRSAPQNRLPAPEREQAVREAPRATGALMGVNSAQETRAASARGQVSRGVSAPRGGGGGGGQRR